MKVVELGKLLATWKWLAQLDTETTLALLFSPLVLATNLVFLLRGEVILNVERLADLLGRLALDHVGDSLATDIEKSLDVKVVGGLVDWSAAIRTLGCGAGSQG